MAGVPAAVLGREVTLGIEARGKRWEETMALTSRRSKIDLHLLKAMVIWGFPLLVANSIPK